MKKKLFVVAIILLISLLAFNIKIAKCASKPRVNPLEACSPPSPN